MAKFPELMNELAKLKNDSISLTKDVSAKDDKIYQMVDESIDGLECSLDVCNNPNREVQIPFSKIYTEDLVYAEQDDLMKKVAGEFNNYKSSFEESSKKVIDLIKKYREKLKGIQNPIEGIKNETDNSYRKFKEALDILAQPLSYIVEGFNVEELRKKELQDKDKLKRLKELLDELKSNFEKYNTSLKGFNEDTTNLFESVTKTDNTLSSFVEVKMLEKIKGIPSLLNKGISFLPESSRKMNKFNDNIKKKKGDTSAERVDFYDKSLNEVLKMTKNVDNEIYNSNKGIESDFNELNEKVKSIKDEVMKRGDAYNNYIKQLKEYSKKIIDLVEEIRKLFDLPKVEFNFIDKDIEYPFYEYAKKLNKGFEEIQEIKEEVQKPMKLVMVVFGKQINTVTLDLLFIMDITESMQDLLDETRNSIKYIVDKIKKDSPGIDVRFAYEGYRDFADLKEGEKYYTIDFETDMNVFKSKLDEIKAKGGGDDAEDVAGGLNAGLNMTWRSNARYAILIADAPGHGTQYHDKDVEDDYPKGDPNGLVLEEIMRQYVKKNINLCLCRIDDYTDIMFSAMKKAYDQESQKSTEKPKIQEIPYDDEEEEQQQKEQQKDQKQETPKEAKKDDKKEIKQKTTMGNIVAKTAIEIYNQYSKKGSITA